MKRPSANLTGHAPGQEDAGFLFFAQPDAAAKRLCRQREEDARSEDMRAVSRDARMSVKRKCSRYRTFQAKSDWENEKVPNRELSS